MRRGLRALVSFLDPRTYFQIVRILHFYHYSHVSQRGKLTLARTARIAPNVSFRHAERISIGAGSHIGERAYLWAGAHDATITIGEHCRFGPEVFVTAVNYGMRPGEPMAYQERSEADIVIGNDVWLGARVFVGAGVTIGDGCVVSANSVVTRDLPPSSIAVGVPARVVRRRDDYAEPGRTLTAVPDTEASAREA
jgi:acetyltransferase-like isoleucine patch superfamily enzyme